MDYSLTSDINTLDRIQTNLATIESMPWKIKEVSISVDGSFVSWDRGGGKWWIHAALYGVLQSCPGLQGIGARCLFAVFRGEPCAGGSRDAIGVFVAPLR